MSWYIPERPSNNYIARSGTDKKRNKKAVLIVSIIMLLSSLVLCGYVWAKNEVNLQVDGKILKVSTMAGTVEELLKGQGIELDKTDQVKPGLGTELTEGMLIKVIRSFPVVINDGGIKKEIKTVSIPVKELLSLHNIKLNPMDRITPDISSKTSRDMVIEIVRVEIKKSTKLVSVPFAKEIKKDNKMLDGRKKVIQKGVNGVNEQTIETFYENGKVRSTKVIKVKVVKQPKKEVVKVGTLKRMSRGGRNFSYSRMLVVSSTGYTHTGHRTSTGIWPHYGVVAVDPGVIPLGTRLYIDGYGYAVALDRGSSVNGNEIDLFFDTYRESMGWGRRTTRVYILD